jgi:hypothetical protein
MAKDTTKNGHVRDREVDGKLELQEALHVPVEVATPHQCSTDMRELALEKNDISRILCDITSAFHDDSNTRFLKSSSISHAITDDSALSLILLKNLDEE